MPGASCCGEGVIRQINDDLQLALNARTFALAEKEGLDILTPSATCFGNMWEDLQKLKNQEKVRERINTILLRTTGLEFSGQVNIRHLLHVLVEEVSLEKISSKVVNPLELHMAAFYGPTMLLEGACGTDDPWNPTYLEDLLEALGGVSKYYDERCQSVGCTSLLSQERTALKMTAEVLNSAKNSGAHVVVSACPFSHINLDSYQIKAGRISKKDTDIPVIHLPEAVAFALGMLTERLAYLRTRVIMIGN